MKCFLIVFLVSGISGFAGCTSQLKTGICLEFGASEKFAKIDDAQISESSGLAISTQYENVLWTHNDSGGEALVFAMNSKGASLGQLNLGLVSNHDWEALSLGPCGESICLFVGDIGDNNEGRDSVVLWRLEEPNPPGEGLTMLVSAESVEAVYPDGPRDSEAMAVDPETGDTLLIEKSDSSRANVYRLSNSSWGTRGGNLVELEFVATIDLKVDSLTGGMITGADVAPAGHEIFVRTYVSGFQVPITRDEQGLVVGFGEPVQVSTFNKGQCESAAYSPDGLELWFTCEEENGPIAKAECVTIQDEFGQEIDVGPGGGCEAVPGSLWLFWAFPFALWRRDLRS